MNSTKWQRTESCIRLIPMHIQLQDCDNNLGKKRLKKKTKKIFIIVAGAP